MASPTDRIIYVIIGCDVDQDRDYFIKDIPADSLGWAGLTEGIPRAKKILKGLTDCDGNPPVFTWNLRVDYQIKKIYGSYDYILTTYKDFLLELEQKGDELAWHPHFWDFDESRKVWYQNYSDTKWQVRMLREAYNAYQNVLPGRGQTVRTGWSYHNNFSFNTLDELGIKTDIGGCPGLKILPQKKQRKLSNFYDWSITPDKPYHPSADDYRRKAKNGERKLSILAVPNFVSHSFMWGMFSGMVLAVKMRDLKQIGYALARPTFMSTTTVKPSLFKPMLSAIKKELKTSSKVIYSSLLHPDELTANVHPVYSLENMAKNIKSLLDMAEKNNAKVKYLRACDIKSIL